MVNSIKNKEQKIEPVMERRRLGRQTHVESDTSSEGHKGSMKKVRPNKKASLTNGPNHR